MMTLSFININKSRKAFIILLFITMVCYARGHNNPTEHYTVIYENNDQYRVSFYDDNKKLLYSETYSHEPHVSIMDGSIVKVEFSVGNPAYYVLFFDTVDFKVSPPFFNPSYIGRGIIIYREDEKKLVIRDIFDKEVLCFEVLKDFSPSAVPSLTVLEVIPLENGLFKLKYLKGPNFVITTETIDINTIN